MLTQFNQAPGDNGEKQPSSGTVGNMDFSKKWEPLDTPKTEGDTMPNRRHRLRRTIPFISLLFIGLLGFNRVALSPRFESYRTLDVVQLLVSGACFGAVMVGVIGTFVRPRH